MRPVVIALTQPVGKAQGQGLRVGIDLGITIQAAQHPIDEQLIVELCSK